MEGGSRKNHKSIYYRGNISSYRQIIKALVCKAHATQEKQRSS